MRMQLRVRKRRRIEQTDIPPRVRQKMLLSAKPRIASLPVEVLCMICCHLSVQYLKELCCVSRKFRSLVQPMIFAEFHSGLYNQRGLWKRLQLLAIALTSSPTLGQKIFHISVQLAELQHVEKLAQLLDPILDKATNLRSLSLPIHGATSNLLDSRTFDYLGEDLKIETAYDGILGLHEITLIRSPVQCGHPYTYHRPDELQLQPQHMVIGSCQLDYPHTIRLLQRLRRLNVVEFCEVSLGDYASLSCESKVAGIVNALSSSKSHLTKLALHIKGCRSSESEITRISSFESFSLLQDLEMNEHDLAANAVFPASLTSLLLVDWDKEPIFPFTRNLAHKSLPLHLESTTSSSRNPDILRQMLRETWIPRKVEIRYHRYDDSLLGGTFRTPESPS